MDLLFRIRHYTQHALLTVLGPADRGERSEPQQALDQKWEERFGSSSPAKAG